MSRFSLFFNIALFFPLLFRVWFFFPSGWSRAGKVMTYLPQLGRSQSRTGGVLTQCPSRAFLPLISMIMLLLDQWREPWKTQLPGSPVPLLAPLSPREWGMWLICNRGLAVISRTTEKGAVRPWDPSVGKPHCWLQGPVTSCFAAGIQMHPDESSESSYLLLPQRWLSSHAQEGL